MSQSNEIERDAEPTTSPDPVCNERGIPESECPSHCAHGCHYSPGRNDE